MCAGHWQGHCQSNSRGSLAVPRQTQPLCCWHGVRPRCSHTAVPYRAYLEELALVEAVKVVFALAFRAEQKVEEGKPHLPVELGHLHLILRGHLVPRTVLKLLELA